MVGKTHSADQSARGDALQIYQSQLLEKITNARRIVNSHIQHNLMLAGKDNQKRKGCLRVAWETASFLML
jgi:hypothetical protein